MPKEVTMDAFQIVTNELDKYNGVKRPTGSGVFICCPFHDENTPSLSINLSQEGDVRVGTWYCFGCQQTGGWNKLAKALGLEQVKNWQFFDGDTSKGHTKVSRLELDIQVFTNPFKKMMERMGGQAIPWPVKKSWRNYGGKTLHFVGAYMVNDKKKDAILPFFPVYVNGKFRGGVKALWDKPEFGPSYINTEGEWVKNYGLLGFDMLPRNKNICIVEGPRDWLRLLEAGIPAVSNLGAGLFSERKLMLLMGKGCKKIYVLPDNDTGGRKMAESVYKICKDMIDVEVLELPRKYENKKLIKLDPDSASDKVIKQVKEIVKGA